MKSAQATSLCAPQIRCDGGKPDRRNQPNIVEKGQPRLKLAEHLYNELHQRGVDHAFGIPGDFALSLWAALEQSPLQGIVLAHEPAVGFAADAYARMRGMGLAIVTYGVGGLNMVNPTAEAYAEKSPLVIVSGSPGIRERHNNPLLHHKVKTFDSQRKVYEEVTRGAFLLDNPLTAARVIQEALQLVEDYKQPVYLEVPRDLVFADIMPSPVEREPRTIDRGALLEAVSETVGMIINSDRPAILGCVEMHRFGLQSELRELAERTGIPIAATMLGKGVFPEDHPLYMGIYVGGASGEELRQYIEGSDCLLMLGTYLSDFNMGIFTHHLEPRNAVHATSENIRVKYHVYHDVPLQDFMRELLRSPRLGRRTFAFPGQGPSGGEKSEVRRQEAEENGAPSSIEPSTLENVPVSMQAIVDELNRFIRPEHLIVTDVGDCLFAGLDVHTRHAMGFLSPAYYLSMGFGIPGAIGAQIADPNARPILLIGDGAFQMMGMELLSARRYHLNPIILLLNNASYATLRFMNPESQYTDIPTTNYADLARVLGGQGFSVNTVQDLRDALAKSQEAKDVCLLDIHLSPDDTSQVLQNLAAANRKRIGVAG
jgi:TPP-dependent 2-oxoacid decarboxylase